VYSSKDKLLARTLVEALTKRGLRVWYDEDSIRVGDSFLSSIGDALEHSRYFVSFARGSIGTVLVVI